MGSNHKGHEQGRIARIVFCQHVGRDFNIHVFIIFSQKVQQEDNLPKKDMSGIITVLCNSIYPAFCVGHTMYRQLCSVACISIFV